MIIIFSENFCFVLFFSDAKNLGFHLRYHFFCNMDGFFRILKKRLSELICTRLYIHKVHTCISSLLYFQYKFALLSGLIVAGSRILSSRNWNKWMSFHKRTTLKCKESLNQDNISVYNPFHCQKPRKFASNHKVSSFFPELWFSQNFYFSFANCYAFADDCTVNHHDEKMPGLEGELWEENLYYS